MQPDYTVFEYLYRDAGNYKAWGQVLLTGRVSAEDELAFRSCLDSGEFFVAEDVGVPSLQRELWALSGGPTEDDHGWHEFHEFRPASPEELVVAPWGSVAAFLAKFRDLLETRPARISPIFASL